MDLIREAPLQGAGIWDWWRPMQTRPWSLALLLVGQFGLIGFTLALGGPLFVALRTLMTVPKSNHRSMKLAEFPLAVIILLSLADALLNSFFYFPALFAAGAIADTHRHVAIRGRTR